MKKLNLLIFALFTAYTAFSQITQEKIFVSEEIDVAELIELESVGIKYFYADNKNFTIKIYNTDHSIYKSIPIDTDALGLANYPNCESIIYPFGISEKLFDNDNKIEFLLNIYAQSSDWLKHIQKTVIINEDGTILFDKLNQEPANSDQIKQFPDWIKNTANGTKMILMNSNDSENDTVFVYSLPGEVPCFSCNDETTHESQPPKTKRKKLSNYPNPATDYTTIEYSIPKNYNEATIQIFNLNGQLVKSYKVDKTFSNLRVYTSDFKNGTYIYNIKTGNQLSEGKKLVISK